MSSDRTGLGHTRTLDVFWGDCDAAGVVFYPRYYAWFDASTHAMLTAAGLDHPTLRARFGALGTPLVQASARFLGPVTYGDRLRAECVVTQVGTKSFTVQHRLHLGDHPVVEGEEVRVWAEAVPGDRPAMRAAPIPDAVRSVLEGRG
ncbi:MAG: acyl-CoA thioesterase [Myxococcales bacterium]|nr:acyl-CoA thioesterase [Myxococcales bacterium]